MHSRFTCVPILLLTLLLPAVSCDLPEAPLVAEPSTPQPVSTPTETPTLVSRFTGAEQIVVATVDRVSAAFGENEHGDRLILSTVTLRVDTTLRGAPATLATFQLEGGQVGELKLEVSDLPALHPGDRGLFALRRTTAGGWVPNRRGLGILQLQQLPDARQLLQLRRAERGSLSSRDPIRKARP